MALDGVHSCAAFRVGENWQCPVCPGAVPLPGCTPGLACINLTSERSTLCVLLHAQHSDSPLSPQQSKWGAAKAVRCAFVPLCLVSLQVSCTLTWQRANISFSVSRWVKPILAFKHPPASWVEDLAWPQMYSRRFLSLFLFATPSPLCWAPYLPSVVQKSVAVVKFAG